MQRSLLSQLQNCLKLQQEGREKELGVGKLGVATGQILGHGVVSLESIVTCSGSPRSPPQTGPMLMPALPLSGYAVAPDFW